MGRRVWLIGLCLVVLTASTASAGGRAWWQAPRVEDNLYLDISMRSDPTVVGAEIAVAHAYGDYLSARIGFEALASETPHYFFGGFTAGARLTLPWRLAPFVGVGGFIGWWDEEVRAEAHLVADDWDGVGDEIGETKEVITDGVIVVYPEVGIHLWLADSVRLTLSGRYHVTTAGGEHDAWLANVGLSLLVSP
jgi:hypothetical protein